MEKRLRIKSFNQNRQSQSKEMLTNEGNKIEPKTQSSEGNNY